MVNWSETVLSMIDDGESYENIIAHFNHPVINKEFIDNAIDSRYRLTRTRVLNRNNLQRSVPAEGTQLRVVYDYVMSHGGLKGFLHHAKKERSLSEIARELKVPQHAVGNFVRCFFYPRVRNRAGYLGIYPDMHRRVKMQQLVAGTYKPKRKRLTTKAARELW